MKFNGEPAHMMLTSQYQQWIKKYKHPAKADWRTDPARGEFTYRSLVDQTSDALMLCDQNTRIIDWNQAAEALTGIPRSEALGQYSWNVQARITVDEHRTPELVTQIQKNAEELSRSGNSPRRGSAYQVQIQRPDGTRRWIETLTFTVPAGGRFMTCRNFKDITPKRQAELDLQKSEKRFRALFEQAPFAIGTVRDGALLYTNPRFCQMFGFEGPDATAGFPSTELVAPQMREAMRQRMQQREAGQPTDLEYETVGLRRDGTQIPLHAAVTLIELADGMATMVSLVDITGRKQTEARLRQSEADFKKAQQIAHVGSWKWDLRKSWLEWSDESYLIFGINKTEFSGSLMETFWQAIHPEDRSRVEEHTRDLIQGITVIATEDRPNEYLLIRPDGSTRTIWVETGDISRNPSGIPESISGNYQDITDRKKNEDALREINEKLEMLFDILPVGVSVLDRDNRVIKTNQALKNILDLTDDGLATAKYTHRSYLKPDGSILPNPEFPSSRVLRGESAVTEPELGVVKEDGSVTWIESTAVACPFSDWRVLLVTSEITQRKMMETKLRESEQRFRTLIEEAPIAIGISRARQTLYGNPKYLGMFGIDQQADLVGHPLVEQVSLQDRQMMADWGHRRFLDQPVDNEYLFTGLRKDGTEFPVWAAVARVELADGPASIGFFTDITARVEAEKEIQRINQLLETVVQSSPLAINALDLENRVILWSPAAERLFGWKTEEVIGHTLPTIPAAERMRFGQIMIDRLKGATFSEESKRIRKDGQLIDVSISTATLKDAYGQIAGTMAIFEDITQRKAAETRLRQSEEDLRKAQKASHVGSWRWDIQANRVTWSDELYAIFGIDRDSITGSFADVIYTAVHPEDRERVAFADQKLDPRKIPDSIEYRVIWPDGSVREVWGESGEVALDSAGKPAYQTGIVQDITQRKLAEKALRESEARERERATELKTIMDTTPALVYVSRNRECRQMVTNRWGYEFLNLPEGSNVSGSTPEGARPGFMKAYIGGNEISPDEMPMQITARTGIEQKDYEFDGVFDDGVTYHLFGNTTPLFDQTGNPNGAVGVFIDITRSKEAEQATRSSESKYRGLFSSMSEGFSFYEIINDPLGNPVDFLVLDVNPAFEAMIKVPRERVIGRTIREVYAKLDPGWIEMMFEVGRTGKPVRIDNNETVLGHIYAVYAYSPQTGRVAVIISDITDQKQAEIRIRQSEQDLKKAQRVSHVGSWKWNIKTGLSEWSDEMYAIYGMDKETFSGSFTDAINRAVHPEDRERVKQATLNASLGKSQTLFEFRLVRPDGSVRWVWDESGEIILDQAGRPAILHGTVQDITERKLAEQALRQSEERLKLAVQIAHLGIWDWDLTTGQVDWNAEMFTLYGVDPAEFSGNGADYVQFTRADYRQAQIDNINKVLEKGITQAELLSGVNIQYDPKELCIVRPDGSECFTLGDAVVIVDDTGKNVRMVGVTYDNTDRKRSEARLRESEARNRILAEATFEGIVATDQGIILEANPQFFQMFGYTPAGMLGRHITEFLAADEAQGVNQIIQDAQENIGEYHFIRKDGSELISEVHGRSFESAKGPLRISSNRDITARKRAEGELRKQTEILQKIFDHIPVMINLIKRDGTLLLVNREWEHTLGWTFAEIKNQKIDLLSELYPDPEDRRTMINFLANSNMQWGDFKTKIRNGQVIDTAWTMIHLSDGSEIGLGQDITERKRAEEALRTSEARFQTVIKASPLAITSVDRDQNITLWSPAAEHLLGWKSAEVLGRRLEHYFPEELKDDLQSQIQAELNGKPLLGAEVTRLRKDGTPVALRISTAPLKESTGENAGLMAIIEDKTEEKKDAEALSQSMEQLHALSARLTSVREEERANISREIHDELGQALTGMKMDLYWSKDHLVKDVQCSDPQPILAKFTTMLAEIDGLIDSVRRISTDLRPSILDTLGLLPALEWLSGDFQARSGLPCSFQTTLTGLELSPELSTALFRICQESLTNIARHAQATWVKVRLSQTHGELVMVVRDNGRGITDEEINRRSSLGVLGMVERARVFDGKVTFEVTARGGTRMTARFPKPAEMTQPGQNQEDA